MAAKITRAEAERLRHRFPAIDAVLSVASPAPTSEQAARVLVAAGVPVVVAMKSDPAGGRWEVKVANWTPASDNIRARGLKRWIKAKRLDREVIRDWLAGHAAVPRATTRRWLAVVVEKKGPLPDGQNLLKSLCDALVNTGLLVDDSADWLDVVTPVVIRGAADSTTILLEDLP